MYIRSPIKPAGFTLVEILVALTLFSLVLVMVFNSLYSAGLSWKKGAEQADINDYQRLDLTFLCRQLSQTVPLVMIDGKKNPLMFTGDYNSIHFISSLPSHRGSGGLAIYDVRMTRQGNSKALVLEYRPVTPGMKFFEETKPDDVDVLVLVKNIEEIQFSYYGKQKADDSSGWQNRWNNSDQLPDLIKLRVIQENPKQYFPDMVVPIHNQVTKGKFQLILNDEYSPVGDQVNYSDGFASR